MDISYSDRMEVVPKSFIREILKVTERPEVISFAGGLPNPELFPIEEISNATEKVLKLDGKKVLQYSTTEGYLPLRQYIAKRYYKNCNVTEGNILITSGSQQALDLIAKVLINKDDCIMLERPGYLGAIQCFSMFQPNFVTVGLNNDGIDIEEFKFKININQPKLFYAVTNFQNPTGVCYSNKIRKEISNIIKEANIMMIDDNPYGELRFMGEEGYSMKALLGDKVISLGSFSKVFAPAMRLGWLCASNEIIDKLVVMKQASDLHTNYFSQRVLYQYLLDNNIDTHISEICNAYKKRRDYMVDMIKKYIPTDVSYTEPEGGMFLWMRLPNRIIATTLLQRAIERNIAFVPGVPFYAIAEENPNNTLRLNFTNSRTTDIEQGIKTLARLINEFS